MNTELSRHIEQVKQVNLIHEIVDKLATEVNVMGDHTPVVEAFSSALQKQHRTLQQNIVGALVEALHRYGDVVGTDLRNEQAAEYCKKLPPANFPLI